LTKVDVTAPEVLVLRLPAARFERVSVTVTLGLSTSLTTMSVRFSGVSSVKVSAVLRLVAMGDPSKTVTSSIFQELTV